LRYYLHESRKAVWSRRIALLSILLFAVTFALHRLGEITGPGKIELLGQTLDFGQTISLSTPLAMRLSGISIVGAVIAAVIGFVALGGIWREGFTGAGKAVVGIVLSAFILAVPLWSMPNLLSLPRLYEVSTDTQRPPSFEKIAALRSGEGVNPPNFQRASIELQSEAYPDIKPLSLKRSTDDAYSAVREAVKNLRWRIVAENPPANGNVGSIEATDRSMIFGFTDDVAIRVSGIGNRTRVDVRASARHGDHDLGRNAERVRDLFSEVKTRLAEIDQNEAMQQAIALREMRLKKALEEKERERIAAEREERKRRQRAAALSRERQISSNGSDGRVERQFRRDRFESRGSNERVQNKRQRRATRTRALRKFWEQLNQ
jgi:uncharacterized protein (DUF1499 family)